MQASDFMAQAFALAQQADPAEVPIAALIVDSKTQKIVSQSTNQCQQLSDPTAHAEMQVIRNATQKLQNKYLANCDLYVTVEPCAMCTAAIALARLRRLYFGVAEPKYGAVISNINFFATKSCHHKIEYYDGFMADEIAAFMKEFFKNKRD